MTRLVEDRHLLDAIRRGERATLAEVYREYVRPLLAMVSTGLSLESAKAQYRFAGYREPWVVENTVQEAFARAFAPGARQRYERIPGSTDPRVLSAVIADDVTERELP
jgi:hypothetical protein